MTRHAFLALAQRLGALSPTDRVQAEPQRLQQWTDRLLWAKSHASRLGPEHSDTRAAVAEADRYSGRPQAPQPWPAPLPASAMMPSPNDVRDAAYRASRGLPGRGDEASR